MDFIFLLLVDISLNAIYNAVVAHIVLDSIIQEILFILITTLVLHAKYLCFALDLL